MTPQWAWASHQPVIQSLINLYKPSFVLESGIGKYSTPILSKVEKYLGVESDKVWIEVIKEKFPDLEILLHELNGINIAERWFNLTSKQRYAIVAFYHELIGKVNFESDKPKMLFVDGFTCTRSFAINVLWKYFDIIVYHDCKYMKVYGYDHLIVKEFTEYKVTSKTAWTGVLLRNDIGFYTFNDSLLSHAKEFDKEWNVTSNTQLLRNDK